MGDRDGTPTPIVELKPNENARAAGCLMTWALKHCAKVRSRDDRVACSSRPFKSHAPSKQGAARRRSAPVATELIWRARLYAASRLIWGLVPGTVLTCIGFTTYGGAAMSTPDVAGSFARVSALRKSFGAWQLNG